MKRMLINAQSNEQLRIAIIDGETLENYQFEVAESGLTRGNIYRGLVANLEASLNAAFINYGNEKNGFLACQDVVAEARYGDPPKGKRPRIDHVLRSKHPIVVQVTRDPEGHKGAALTTNLSLAGRYFVLTPFDDMRGVSRKVEDEETRAKLKDIAKRLPTPEGCGFIVRTNAVGQTRQILERDLRSLVRLWRRIQAEARRGSGIRLLYSDQDLILRVLRDYLDTSIEEVWVDDDSAYEKTERFLHAFMPRSRVKMERYTERLPLFSRFGLESQIERIYQRRVPLPSGGSIVIDGTEALTAIDVNSGRSKKESSQEETALKTNLEAAPEVARQLRLRDIGGLVVVDYIDMRQTKYQRRLEKAQRDALKEDKARTTVGRISANGLLEINRQRLSQALTFRTFTECHTCQGTGRVSSPDLFGWRLLRRIETHAVGGRMKSVEIRLHPEMADAFQNQRRRELAGLEDEFEIDIQIRSAPELGRSEEKIEWTARTASELEEARRAEESREAESETVKAPVEARDLAEGGLRKAEDEPSKDKDDGGPKKTDGGQPPRRRRRRRRRRGGAKRSQEATAPAAES